MDKNLNIKNICPVIGTKLNGKSSILNTLFNINYLDFSWLEIKIVIIIRYNPDITKPKFFKLNVKSDGNDNYSFYKNNDYEMNDEDEIRNKIKIINKELDKNEPKYEDIFYMLETCEVNFIDINFLKENDFADIPAYNEYLVYKKDMNPFIQILKILKNKINKGIFIFSVDNFMHIDNYMVIGKLNLVLNKPIENFLILLNKMDKSKNIEEDIKSLNQKLVEEFPNGEFNITRNTIIQCSSFQLENELKMEKEFSYLIYYHYINYIMDMDKYNNFIEYFKNFIRNYAKKDVINIDVEEFKKNIKSIENDEDIKKIKDIIKKIRNNHDIIKTKLLLDESDFTDENIKKCINNLDDLIENEFGKIDLFEQTNNTIIIVYYYFLYKRNKLKFFKSSETKNILEYFTKQNKDNKSKYTELESKLKDLDNKKKNNYCITKLNEFFNIYKNGGIYLNKIKEIENSLNQIRNNLKNNEYFFIPLIGVSGSGKSTILNDIIGYNLLPVGSGECTKKGILIAHWDYDIPIIRKAKLISENTGDKNDICYFEFNNNIIAEGVENVRKILYAINGNFTDKEEDFFYIINVKIQFLDYFRDNTIKEKICFVDLPGYGTKNKFETKDIYSKFIKSCKLFLMVTSDHFEEKENVDKINELFRKVSKYQGISFHSLIKKILFIINNNQNTDISETSLLNKKKSLIRNLNGITEYSYKDINITFFNAEFYHYYLDKKNLFSTIEYLFHNTNIKYLRDYELYQKGFKNSCERKFENYFIKYLKDNLRTVFNINVYKINNDIDKEINSSFDSYITKNNYSFREKDLVEIKKILSFFKSNIEQCNYINQSNFLNFRFYLNVSIIMCKNESDNDLRRIIENNLDNLDKIFNNNDYLENVMIPAYKEITNESKEKLEKFQKDIEYKIKDIIIEKYMNDVPKILLNSIYEINNYIKNFKNNIDEKLKKKKWKDVENEFENIFQTTIENQKAKIIEAIDKYSDQLKIRSDDAFKLIAIFKTNSEDNYKFDELKIYLANKLGAKNNYKEVINKIINEIIANSRKTTNIEKSSGLLDFFKTKFSDKAYLNKRIDFIKSYAAERLNYLGMNISNLMEQYLSEIMNKISVEKANIINILKEKKRKEEFENIEKEKNNKIEKEKYEIFKKEKDKKWDKIYQEYNKIKALINNTLEELFKYYSQDHNENEETPNPK